jgi:hypothetical protein
LIGFAKELNGYMGGFGFVGLGFPLATEKAQKYSPSDILGWHFKANSSVGQSGLGVPEFTQWHNVTGIGETGRRWGENSAKEGVRVIPGVHFE